MFDSLKKRLADATMTDEWKKANIVEAPIAKQEPKFTPQPQKVNAGFISAQPEVSDDDSSNTLTFTPSSAAADKEMLDSIYKLLEQLNKDGIDMFEVWDAAEQMGGITDTNVKMAFIACKSASAGKLTKEYVVETAQYYRQKIQETLDANAAAKKTEKKNMVAELNSKKENLQAQVTDFENQISQLIAKKEQAESSLSKIDSAYTPKIQKIEQVISSGTKAVQVVDTEIQNFLDVFLRVVK